jgi:hypothetical protein
MYCNNCGSQLNEGANFCRVCGKAVPDAATMPPPIPSSGTSSDAPTADVSSAAAHAAQQIAYQPSVDVPTAGKALGSLISGIAGLTMVPVIASIVAIVLGHLGLSEIKKSAGRLKGEGMALAGLVMGYLGLALIPFIVIVAMIAIPNVLRARLAANETSAIRTVRSINSAEVSHAAANPEKGFTCSVDELNLLSSKSGYNYILRDCESDISDGPVVRYKLIAAPIQFGTTGARTFCSDESGTIRFIKDRSSDACLTDGIPLD